MAETPGFFTAETRRREGTLSLFFGRYGSGQYPVQISKIVVIYVECWGTDSDSSSNGNSLKVAVCGVKSYRLVGRELNCYCAVKMNSIPG